MPINSSTFEKSSGETFVMLKEFLRLNFHIAYSADELAEVLAAKGTKVTAEEVERLLGSMEYGGRIVSKTVDGVTYYRYRKVRGFVPLKKMK